MEIRNMDRLSDVAGPGGQNGEALLENTLRSVSLQVVSYLA